MSKVLIILCLAIVTSMVSSQDEKPPATNVVSAAIFVKNLITVESQLCSTEYKNTQKATEEIMKEVKETTKKWYNLALKKLAYVWIQKADVALQMQRNGQHIHPNCFEIQKKLFNYGTLVGQKLAKCAAPHLSIAKHFNATLQDNLVPYYAELYALGTRAKQCQFSPDLGSTFTCLLRVMFDLFVLPNPRIALDRQLYAAQTHANTVLLQLDNCPYLATVVEYENRASQAAVQINDCLLDPKRYSAWR